MAELSQLSADTLADIARQIGDRIAEEFSSAASAVPPDGAAQAAGFSHLAGLDRATARFKLAETLEVWRLKANAEAQLATTNEDLVTLARPTATYRHLVRLVRDGSETAEAFAQSCAGDYNRNDLIVRDFYFSPLAAKIDEAIRAADADASIPGDAVTRLLSLPEFKVEALWFVTLEDPAGPAPGGGAGPQQPRPVKTFGVIVAYAPLSFKGQTLSLMDSTAFIRALSGTTRGMGLLL